MSAAGSDRVDLARKALLEERLRGARRSHPVLDHGPRIARRSPAEHEPVPLSASQQQLWYLSRLHPESAAYNELVTIRKDGAFDAAAFGWAFNEIVRRHQAWRTTFRMTDGGPRQVVHDAVTFALELTDLSDLPFDAAEAAAARAAADDTRMPYDLASGPLLRPRLVKLSATHHRLYLGLHHLIFDGVTLYRILLPELVSLYDSRVLGTAPQVPRDAVQYPDYALWEQNWVGGPDAACRIERNRARLSGAGALNLPQDYPRPPRQRLAGGMVAFEIPADTVRGLRALAAAHGATLFHTLAAAYAYWLHSFTGDPDVVFATAADLRQFPELEGMMGYCLTPVVLRGTVSPTSSFLDLVAAARAEVVEATGTAVPFETLVRALSVPRDRDRNPLFQAMLVLEPPMDSPDPDWAIHQMETAISAEVGRAKFDISIELDERHAGHLTGRLNYDSSLFEGDTAVAMQQHFVRLLTALLAQPTTALELLRLPSDANVAPAATPPVPNTAVANTGVTDTVVPATITADTITECVLAQAARTPDAAAVQAGARQLSYRELVGRARQIAGLLADAGAVRGSIVGVVLDRGIDLIPGLLAVLFCGAAYLPIDRRFPPARVRLLLADAEPVALLTDAATRAALPELDTPVVAVDDAADSAETFQPVQVSGADAAYLVYTSGSTGKPKGVVVAHRNVATFLARWPATLGLDANSAVLSVVSSTFDVFAGDVFGALSVGARLVLATDEQVRSPSRLAALIGSTSPTLMCATPTTWHALLDADWPGMPGLMAGSVGETLSAGLADALATRCLRVWNGWGPTETTIYVGGGPVAAGEPVTVGHPLPGTTVAARDPRDRLCPVGVPGELVVGGPGVARGYLGQPGLTATRFVADPTTPGARVYRTGDRGRRRADGRIQHLGRYDNQVKVRGFRIELGEIETALSTHPAVHAAAVAARPDAAGRAQLVAYLVGGTAEDDPQVRAWVRERLPDYLVPTVIVHLDRLPVTPSGKLDRNALPDAPRETIAAPAGAPARTDTERLVLRLWSDLLGHPVTAVDIDFFDLGGHSVLAATLLIQVRAQCRVTLELTQFLDRGTTVAGLARLIDAAGADPAPATGRALFFVYPDLASAMSLRHLTAAWGDGLKVHPLLPLSAADADQNADGVEQFAARILAELRNTQPHGPYALVGFSFGGMVAYELARLLADAGEQVDWLGIVDTPTPQLASEFIRRHTSLRARLAQLRRPGRLRRIRRFAGTLRWSTRERLIATGLIDRTPAAEIDLRHVWTIIRGYTRPGHATPLELFITSDTAAEVRSETLGWAQLHRGPMRTHYLRGDHNSILDEPQAGELADLIRSCLGVRAAGTTFAANTAMPT